jgi:hypothetical protein
MEAARPVDAENAPTGLCKTADGFAQLPHASSLFLSQKNDEDRNPSESLVTDPQILRRRPIFFALWGVPFVVVGLYLIVGRFFVDARARARTFYGLTNRRAIIVSGIMSRSTRSIPVRLLTDVSVQERANGTGTVLLGRPHPFAGWYSGMPWPGMDQYSTPGFELIPDAKRVHDQVLEVQRVNA